MEISLLIPIGGLGLGQVRHTDDMQMPDQGLLTGADTMTRTEGYHAMLVHELIQLTGAEEKAFTAAGIEYGECWTTSIGPTGLAGRQDSCCT